MIGYRVTGFFGQILFYANNSGKSMLINYLNRSQQSKFKEIPEKPL